MTNLPPDEQVSRTESPGETDLPLLHTWPALYTFVLIAFVCVVVALWLFTRVYS